MPLMPSMAISGRRRPSCATPTVQDVPSSLAIGARAFHPSTPAAVFASGRHDASLLLPGRRNRNEGGEDPAAPLLAVRGVHDAGVPFAFHPPATPSQLGAGAILDVPGSWDHLPIGPASAVRLLLPGRAPPAVKTTSELPPVRPEDRSLFP